MKYSENCLNGEKNLSWNWFQEKEQVFLLKQINEFVASVNNKLISKRIDFLHLNWPVTAKHNTWTQTHIVLSTIWHTLKKYTNSSSSNNNIITYSWFREYIECAREFTVRRIFASNAQERTDERVIYIYVIRWLLYKSSN